MFIQKGAPLIEDDPEASGASQAPALTFSYLETISGWMGRRSKRRTYSMAAAFLLLNLNKAAVLSHGHRDPGGAAHRRTLCLGPGLSH